MLTNDESAEVTDDENADDAGQDNPWMTEDEKRKDLIDVMEARRLESDRFAWAVPTVAIASQAFLLTIALSEDASAVRRLIASIAALGILLGAWHLFLKQMFGFALYEAVIKRERADLGLPLVALSVPAGLDGTGPQEGRDAV
jgi:hypothetical protein